MLRRVETKKYKEFKKNEKNRKKYHLRDSTIGEDVFIKRKKKSLPDDVKKSITLSYAISSPNVDDYDNNLGKADEPWLPRKVIDHLDSWLTKDKSVLEYGSGSSTIWFAKRVNSVVSIESSKRWTSLIKNQCNNEKLTNVRLEHIRCNGKDYKGYVGYLLGTTESFDLILVDGKERVRVLKSCYKKLNPGGLLILDNSDRVNYKKGIEFIDSLGWKKQIFRSNISETTIWEKPK